MVLTNMHVHKNLIMFLINKKSDQGFGLDPNFQNGFRLLEADEHEPGKTRLFTGGDNTDGLLM
jgi:hypothetical protein